MTETGNASKTAKQLATEAAEVEFEFRMRQFGGQTKLAQMHAREAYDAAMTAAKKSGIA